MAHEQILLGVDQLKNAKNIFFPPNPITSLMLENKALVFDAVVKEDMQQVYNHSIYPSQDGAFSDHFSFRQPLKLTLEVSHSDIISFKYFDFVVKNIANLGLSLGVVTSETIQDGLKYIYASNDFINNKHLNNSQDTRSSRMLQNILNIAKSYAMFKIQTAKATYKNMSIEEISYINQEETETILNVSISFIERKQHNDIDSLYDPKKMVYESDDYIKMRKYKKIGSFVAEKIGEIF